MPRRRRVGERSDVKAERSDGVEPIQLLATETGDVNTSETVQSGGGVRTGVAVALLAVAVGAILALVLSSADDADPVVTEDDDSTSGDPSDEDMLATDAPDTTDGPLRSSEPRFGDGPTLQWESVPCCVETSNVRWINGAFVGDDGVTEWRIDSTADGPRITERSSVLTGYPDHYIVDAEGGRVLAPRVDQPDQLLFIDADDGVTRVELPVRPPVTDLVRRRARIDAAVIDDAAVVVIERTDEMNPETLGPRIGWDFTGRQARLRSITDELTIVVSDPDSDVLNGTITISVADTDLTATELEALTPRPPAIEMLAVDLRDGSTGPAGVVPDVAADVGVAGDRFVLAWQTGDLGRHVATSTTGRSWQPSANRVGVVALDGDARSIVGRDGNSNDVARSLDGGSSWLFTPEPVPKYVATVVGDVLALRSMASGQDGLDVGVDYAIDLDDYELIISGGGRSFQLLDPESGEVVTEGVVSDSASGAAFDPFGAGLAVTDPVTGGELTVSQNQLWMAFATTDPPLASPQTVATARWSSAADPEWRLEPITEIFGTDARRVEFVGGDGYLLAIVATTNGLDLHLAPVS